MSTIILGRLARPVERARYAEEVAGPQPDERKHWVEALAAIIPGEALAATTTVLTFFTVKGSSGAKASLDHETTVRVLSLVILFAIPIVYAASSGRIVGRAHIVRWLAAMVAFAAWQWLLPLSAWDTITKIVDIDETVRAASGVVAALVIVSGAAYLFKRWPVPT